jgi:hypothetical protein
MRKNRVIVIGAGGVGYWLTAALQRDLKNAIPIIVWDDDTFIGGDGWRRLPSPADSRQSKVDGLEEFLESGMRDLIPAMTFVKARFTPDVARSMDLSDALVIDCSDMAGDERRPVWAAAEGVGATMMRVSYDGAQGGIIVVAHGLPLADLEGSGYAELPGMDLSLAAGGLGARVARAWLEGVEWDSFQFNVISNSELKAQRASGEL